MQASKKIKKLRQFFLNNLDLAFIWNYLNYKNVDKIRALLTELPYDTIFSKTKNINIRSIIANMALKIISFTI